MVKIYNRKKRKFYNFFAGSMFTDEIIDGQEMWGPQKNKNEERFDSERKIHYF